MWQIYFTLVISTTVKTANLFSGERNFLCPQCGRQFGTKFNMDEHVKMVHDGKTNTY